MSSPKKTAKSDQSNGQDINQKEDQEIDFEKAMSDLETLVSGMESGDLPLEESLKKFEQGIALSRRCQRALNDAEQRVKVLLDDQEEAFHDLDNDAE